MISSPLASSHGGGGALLGDDFHDFGAGADLRAMLLGGAGEGSGEIADAAAHEAGGAQRAVGFADLVVQQVKRRALLARSDEGAKHGTCRQAGFKQIVFKPFVQQIGYAHRQDAQELVPFFVAETVKF